MSEQSLVLLSRLIFPPQAGHPDFSSPDSGIVSAVVNMSAERFNNLVNLANSNHVIMRALEIFRRIAVEAGDPVRGGWAETALAGERARIDNALKFLSEICAEFERRGYGVAVIKSLDHWPDIGSDLDLYTSTRPDLVCSMMQSHFGATIAARSWGDRLAGKWNFEIPGLPEAVEVHMGRLGQTGEQITLANSLLHRSRVVEVADRKFRTTSTSDRLMISTLQRMYRHFYFRLCDIVDSCGLVEGGAVDFEDLHRSALAAGIWEGVATYLVIVSDYVKQYRGTGIDLPRIVIETARFGGEQVYFARDFIRVPIMPQSAGLYGTQLTGLLRKGEYVSSARLGLLPWLATAAMVGMKITGSDKGIW